MVKTALECRNAFLRVVMENGIKDPRTQLALLENVLGNEGRRREEAASKQLGLKSKWDWTVVGDRALRREVEQWSRARLKTKDIVGASIQDGVFFADVCADEKSNQSSYRIF